MEGSNTDRVFIPVAKAVLRLSDEIAHAAVDLARLEELVLADTSLEDTDLQALDALQQTLHVLAQFSGRIGDLLDREEYVVGHDLLADIPLRDVARRLAGEPNAAPVSDKVVLF